MLKIPFVRIPHAIYGQSVLSSQPKRKRIIIPKISQEFPNISPRIPRYSPKISQRISQDFPEKLPSFQQSRSESPKNLNLATGRREKRKSQVTNRFWWYSHVQLILLETFATRRRTRTTRTFVVRKETLPSQFETNQRGDNYPNGNRIICMISQSKLAGIYPHQRNTRDCIFAQTLPSWFPKLYSVLDHRGSHDTLQTEAVIYQS